MKNLVNYHGHRATSHDCDNVLLLLDDYECVSGQKINKNKTTMRHIKIALEDRKFSNREILGAAILCGKGEKMLVLTILRRESGGNCKDGKNNFCHMLEEKS